MKTHERMRQTSAPPEAVWRLWSEPATWPDWNPDVASMTVQGAFAKGARAVMKTRAGRSHEMLVTAFEPGREFRLETSPLPGTRFTFICRVAPAPGGSTISQGIVMRGPLAAIMSPMAGERIAESFRPILDGLAAAAEAKAGRE